MFNPIDRRIEERQQKLDALRAAVDNARALIASLERDASEVEIELRTYRDARSLFDEPNKDENSSEQLIEAHEDKVKGLADQSDGSFRMSEATKASFVFALSRYPLAASNKEFLEYLTEQGHSVDRNHLRSALWTHASRGLLDKVGTGLYKITALGASRIGEHLPE